MIIVELQEFFQLLKIGQPIIALDYGIKKLGIAISTPDHKLSVPLTTNYAHSDQSKILYITELINQNKVCALVLGLPLNMDSSKSAQTIVVEKFAYHLAKKISIPIILQDERLTSKAADNFLKNFGLNRKQRSMKEDMVAASMILETVLHSLCLHLEQVQSALAAVDANP